MWPCPKKDPPKVADDVPYELAEPQGWAAAVAAFGQHPSGDGATVTLTGKCRRCTHQMSVELPIKARTGKGVSDAKDGQSLGKRSFTKVAYCNCGAAHEGRPDDTPDGCGAFGALLVGEKAQPGQDRIVSVEGAPGTAAIHDVQWERKAEADAGQILTTARSSAEKWTQTIASLTGVFTLVLVVKGPEDVSKVHGTADLGLGGVPTWLVVVAAVLALGLLTGALCAWRKGWSGRGLLFLGAGVLAALLLGAWADGSWSHFTMILVLLGAGVALAATSIVTGGLAAFGLPSGFIAASGAILRQRQSKQTLLTRSLLRASLYTATVTLAAVGAAVVLTWLHTGSTAKPTSVLVVTDPTGAAGAQVLCGPIATAALPDGLQGTTIAVDTSAGTAAAVPVPLSSVDLLAPVVSCGAQTP